jgi:hypothetical protein
MLYFLSEVHFHLVGVVGSFTCGLQLKIIVFTHLFGCVNKI